MALEAIIFAVDGVLAETHEARREAFNEVFSEAEVGWYWDRASYGDLLKATSGHGMIAEFVRVRAGKWRHPRDLSNMIGAMERRHAALLLDRFNKRRVQMRDGVIAILHAAARDDIAIAIATRENADEVRALLETRLSPNLAATVEIVAGRGGDVAGDVRNVHAAALEQLGLTGRKCLAVESSARGVGDARAAGLPVLLTWGNYPRLEECGEALSLAGAPTLFGASSAVLSRWDCATPTEVLAYLRDVHALQCRLARPAAKSSSYPSAIHDKEMSDAGFGHLEA
jgi:beta-phosphoglucomutase-like phosphatase (HAD superfamily)